MLRKLEKQGNQLQQRFEFTLGLASCVVDRFRFLKLGLGLEQT